MNTARVLLAATLAVGATAVGYGRLLRQPILTWGATDDEVAATLPGDDLLPEADGVSTRAITISARPEHVYPWLAQMGPDPRGGAYTYDWIENLLGLHMHSTDHVLEEFQHPMLGEVIALGPNRMRVALVEPGRAFATRSEDGNWVWAFTLVECGDSTTRLISRNRFRLPRLTDRIGMLPMEPGSLIMERKMLYGIKERAETLTQEATATT
ncbi:SRPBCC family protein [Gordonia sp. SL306]|uniref:SRPBCC family protein n=1 Tax=Gordonia sp. SL306 TaxID=2995145 RepID=UPI00226D972B|nr:SRPBCC family protein [Gordonia sp. SL306]WAC57898.1 SRPBCC family protein [Gordonia sp. SL306]